MVHIMTLLSSLIQNVRKLKLFKLGQWLRLERVGCFCNFIVYNLMKLVVYAVHTKYQPTYS